ncbi:unnamed protein product [Lepeophtheirus salmonis]|uniref:(salmon louse) hypothetical protein n=1 Tax=Lepeophtheirus salmonis TaxID=72036 RepID=A0A0K2TDR4_LEPSM|nr:unnamed protein product [Lepeophtheirus salmonis]CAF2802144.1 unnamed protein product [Lepeophtheirus salmonis]
MLSCSPIGNAAGLPTSEDPGILPFSGWTQKLKLTKKVLKHKTIFPKIAYFPSAKDTHSNHDFIFQRFLTVRNSFRSLKVSSSSSPSGNVLSPSHLKSITPLLSSSTPLNRKESTLEPPNRTSGGCSTLEGSSSKDSGLGEEEEATSISHGILSTRSPSESSTSHKKHVMIREPSLSHLPSARRKIFNSCRVVRTRVYKGPKDLPDPSNTTKSQGGTVQNQWDNLYTKAYEELLLSLPGLEPAPLKIIFHREEFSSTATHLPGILEVEEISSVLRTIYSILYHNWQTHSSSKSLDFLSLSLHCIQMFLVSVVQYLDLSSTEDEEDIKERFERKFGELLKNCELIGYSNVDTCLRKSQRVFIEFWCNLLNVPLLKDSFSPSERRNILRLSLGMVSHNIIREEEEEGILSEDGVNEKRNSISLDIKSLKHRSSVF